MKKKLFYTFYFYIFFQFGISQKIVEVEEDAVTSELVQEEDEQFNSLDNSTYYYEPNARYFSDKFQEKYKKDKAFDYTNEEIPEVEKPKNKPSINLSFLSSLGTFIMYIFVIALVALLIYVFYISYKNAQNSKEVKSSKKIKTTEEVIENKYDIQKNSYDILIQKHENENNYRLAFRYHFLWILQQFTIKNFIIWEKKKTNYDYLIELIGTKHENNFRELSFIFEYVWYGEFKLSETQYEKLKIQCINFRNSI